jgi:hypothetical protein
MWNVDLDFELKDWLVIIATVLGPILAVQAQKVVERYRERRSRKLNLFAQLMATRAARLSPDHVQALNMIDLVFYGNRRLGKLHRSKHEQAVLDAWKEYLDSLGNPGSGEATWNARDEIFTNLLYAIAQDVGLRFDRVQLKRGAYTPQAHEDLELEHRAIRKHVISTLSGEHPLKMQITGFAVDPAAVKTQQEFQSQLIAAIQGSNLRLAATPREEVKSGHA